MEDGFRRPSLCFETRTIGDEHKNRDSMSPRRGSRYCCATNPRDTGPWLHAPAPPGRIEGRLSIPPSQRYLQALSRHSYDGPPRPSISKTVSRYRRARRPIVRIARSALAQRVAHVPIVRLGGQNFLSHRTAGSRKWRIGGVRIQESGGRHSELWPRNSFRRFRPFRGCPPPVCRPKRTKLPRVEEP